MFIRRAAGAGSGVEGACALADCSVICWRPRHWASRADDRPSRVTEGGLGDEAVSGMHGFRLGAGARRAGRGREGRLGDVGRRKGGRRAALGAAIQTRADRACLPGALEAAAEGAVAGAT